MITRTLLAVVGMLALLGSAQAQTQGTGGGAGAGGQYVPLHPLPPPTPGSVDVLPDMPPVHTQAGVNYVSGGVGGGEREALRAAAADFNLHLLFAAQGNMYLSDIKVTVTDQSGVVVLDAVSDGPYFMAKLPAGRYRVTADDGNGSPQSRSVTVPERGASSTSFFWRS